MGYFDSGILGGDTPWDALGEMSRVVGWKSIDRRGNHSFENMYGDHRHMDIDRAKWHRRAADLVRKNRVKVWKLVEHYKGMKDNQSHSILAIVFMSIDFGCKPAKEIEKIARQAVIDDPWDKTDHERLDALDDFTRRLDRIMGKGDMKGNRRFAVKLTRKIEESFDIEISAFSRHEVSIEIERFLRTKNAMLLLANRTIVYSVDDLEWQRTSDKGGIEHMTEIPE